jgi:hypothetical protein
MPAGRHLTKISLPSVFLCRESCSRQTRSLPRAGLCRVRHSTKDSLSSARQKALGKAPSTWQSHSSDSKCNLQYKIVLCTVVYTTCWRWPNPSTILELKKKHCASVNVHQNLYRTYTVLYHYYHKHYY